MSFSRISNRVLFALALFFIMGVGAWIRFSATPLHLTNNVVSYYVQRSQYLWYAGTLPQKDIWGFAPLAMPENIPPFLAYFTDGILGLLSLGALTFDFSIDFVDFALKFPIIIFALWGALMFLLMRRTFSREMLFFAVLLLVFMPASITLTQGGRYTEEIVGAPLIFFFVLSLLRYLEEETTLNPALLGVAASATFLGLAWPQFPAPFAALAGVALVVFFLRRRATATMLFATLIVALILGHGISTYGIGVEYSPIYMLGEAWRGFVGFRDPDILLALGRTDWVNPTPFEILGAFGGIGVLLFFLGLFRAFRFRAPLKDTALIIFSLFGLVPYLLFAKSIYLFVPIVILTGAYGGEALLSRKLLEELFIVPAMRLFRFWQARYAAKIFLTVLLGGAAGLLLDYAVWSRTPRPSGEIAVHGIPKEITAGTSYPIDIVLQNNGAPTLADKNAFVGLHIEVKNALVKDIRTASVSPSRIVIKPNAIADNWFWFETAYSRLDGNASAAAVFVVVPSSPDFEIRVRGWLPGPCPLLSRFQGMSERTGQYWNPFIEGWRSEACLIRIPALKEQSAAVVSCAVPVFAGYRTPQTFACEKYSKIEKAGPVWSRP